MCLEVKYRDADLNRNTKNAIEVLVDEHMVQAHIIRHGKIIPSVVVGEPCLVIKKKCSDFSYIRED